MKEFLEAIASEEMLLKMQIRTLVLIVQNVEFIQIHKNYIFRGEGIPPNFAKLFGSV